MDVDSGSFVPKSPRRAAPVRVRSNRPTPPVRQRSKSTDATAQIVQTGNGRDSPLTRSLSAKKVQFTRNDGMPENYPLISFSRLEKLDAMEIKYSKKALPPIPDDLTPFSQEHMIENFEKVQKFMKQIRYLKQKAPSPGDKLSSPIGSPRVDASPRFEKSPRKLQLQNVENERIQTLLKTVHRQEAEIEKLKSFVEGVKGNSTSEITSNTEMEALKAANAKLTSEIRNSFIALKIAHSQLLGERKQNIDLRNELEGLEKTISIYQKHESESDLVESLQEQNLKLEDRVQELEELLASS